MSIFPATFTNPLSYLNQFANNRFAKPIASSVSNIGKSALVGNTVFVASDAAYDIWELGRHAYNQGTQGLSTKFFDSIYSTSNLLLSASSVTAAFSVSAAATPILGFVGIGGLATYGVYKLYDKDINWNVNKITETLLETAWYASQSGSPILTGLSLSAATLSFTYDWWTHLEGSYVTAGNAVARFSIAGAASYFKAKKITPKSLEWLKPIIEWSKVAMIDFPSKAKDTYTVLKEYPEVFSDLYYTMPTLNGAIERCVSNQEGGCDELKTALVPKESQNLYKTVIKFLDEWKKSVLSIYPAMVTPFGDISGQWFAGPLKDGSLSKTLKKGVAYQRLWAANTHKEMPQKIAEAIIKLMTNSKSLNKAASADQTLEYLKFVNQHLNDGILKRVSDYLKDYAEYISGTLMLQAQGPDFLKLIKDPTHIFKKIIPQYKAVLTTIAKLLTDAEFQNFCKNPDVIWSEPCQLRDSLLESIKHKYTPPQEEQGWMSKIYNATFGLLPTLPTPQVLSPDNITCVMGFCNQTPISPTLEKSSSNNSPQIENSLYTIGQQGTVSDYTINKQYFGLPGSLKAPY